MRVADLIRWATVRLVVVGSLCVIAACGRLGYEKRIAPDATSDTLPDVARVCPSDTSEITAGSPVCIELFERGSMTWVNAKADCESVGRRLCADAEWYTGCVDAAGIVDMTDGDYEWVAEESGGVAQKRGPSLCTDTASHEIYVTPYIYRCCVDK